MARKIKSTGIIDHDEAITHLQVMHTWADFALDKNSTDWMLEIGAMESIKNWTMEIIRMLQSEEDDGK